MLGWGQGLLGAEMLANRLVLDRLRLPSPSSWYFFLLGCGWYPAMWKTGDSVDSGSVSSVHDLCVPPPHIDCSMGKAIAGCEKLCTPSVQDVKLSGCTAGEGFFLKKGALPGSVENPCLQTIVSSLETMCLAGIMLISKGCRESLPGSPVLGAAF